MVYTIKQVAERWGTTRQSVKTEMEKGNLKYFIFGSLRNPQYRIKSEWLEDYENNGGGEQNGR